MKYDVVDLSLSVSKVTPGPAHSFALTFGPCVRRLPRISLRRGGRYWAARWTAQDGSYVEQEATTRRVALAAVVRWARHQRWPLYVRLTSVI